MGPNNKIFKDSVSDIWKDSNGKLNYFLSHAVDVILVVFHHLTFNFSTFLLSYQPQSILPFRDIRRNNEYGPSIIK